MYGTCVTRFQAFTPVVKQDTMPDDYGRYPTVMKSIFSALCMVCIMARVAAAVQPTVTEAEGYSCMGSDKSRMQTEEDALVNAKRNAAEYTATYIKGETQVKDFALQKDIVSAYTNAEVTIIEDIDKGWYKDPSAGDCYKIRCKAEVTPDKEAMQRLALASSGLATEGNISVPVALPPLPGAEYADSRSAAGIAQTDVVVVPSDDSYVYMAPHIAGVYFYNGFWYRFFERFWFRSMVYGKRWGALPAAEVPRAVMNVPPEYPRYLPRGYERIHQNDLRMKWAEWNRTREWNKHEWFRNELRHDVAKERLALIQKERNERLASREKYFRIKEEARLHPQQKTLPRPGANKNSYMTKQDTPQTKPHKPEEERLHEQQKQQQRALADKNRLVSKQEALEARTQRPMAITQDMVEGREQLPSRETIAAKPQNSRDKVQRQAQKPALAKIAKAEEKKRNTAQKTSVAKQSKSQENTKKTSKQKKESGKKAEHTEHKKD